MNYFKTFYASLSMKHFYLPIYKYITYVTIKDYFFYTDVLL